MSEELLDLSGIAAPRDTIRLPSKKDPAGKTYEVVDPTDLGILAIRRLYALKEEEDRLRASAPKDGGLTPAKTRALRECLGNGVKILIPTIDEATLRMLPTEARERIMLAWTVKHYTADDEAESGAEGEASSRRTTAA